MLLFGTPGWSELLLIAFIVLLLFGKNRLPDLAKSLGTGIREFRKSVSGQFDQEPEEHVEHEEEKPVKKVKPAQVKTGQAKKTKSRNA